MSNFGMFQPEMLMTGAAPCRSAELQVTVRVWDSPGNKVMSLPVQIADGSSLSPGSSPPEDVPRRMSARTRNATAEPEVFVIVTVVSRSAPAGPAWSTVAAVAETPPCGSVRRPVGSAYWVIVACGWPSVLDQSTTSGVVDSQ